MPLFSKKTVQEMETARKTNSASKLVGLKKRRLMGSAARVGMITN
jgi:hypothetical protein